MSSIFSIKECRIGPVPFRKKMRPRSRTQLRHKRQSRCRSDDWRRDRRSSSGFRSTSDRPKSGLKGVETTPGRNGTGHSALHWQRITRPRMTPEQIGRREKLIIAWRAFAQGLTNLGYDPGEVWETMATVARNGFNESDQVAPKQAVEE